MPVLTVAADSKTGCSGPLSAPRPPPPPARSPDCPLRWCRPMHVWPGRGYSSPQCLTTCLCPASTAGTEAGQPVTRQQGRVRPQLERNRPLLLEAHSVSDPRRSVPLTCQSCTHSAPGPWSLVPGGAALQVCVVSESLGRVPRPDHWPGCPFSHERSEGDAAFAQQQQWVSTRSSEALGTFRSVCTTRSAGLALSCLGAAQSNAS